MRDTFAPIPPFKQQIIMTTTQQPKVPMATPAMTTPAMATIIARKYGTVYIDFKVLTDDIEGKINKWKADTTDDMGQLYNSWVESTFINKDELINNAFGVKNRQDTIKKIFKLYDVKIITTLPKCVVKDIINRLLLDGEIKDDNILDDTETLYNKLVNPNNNTIVFYSMTNEHYDRKLKEKKDKLIFASFGSFLFRIPPVINQLIQKK